MPKVCFIIPSCTHFIKLLILWWVSDSVCNTHIQYTKTWCYIMWNKCLKLELLIILNFTLWHCHVIKSICHSLSCNIKFMKSFTGSVPKLVTDWFHITFLHLFHTLYVTRKWASDPLYMKNCKLPGIRFFFQKQLRIVSFFMNINTENQCNPYLYPPLVFSTPTKKHNRRPKKETQLYIHYHLFLIIRTPK